MVSRRLHNILPPFQRNIALDRNAVLRFSNCCICLFRMEEEPVIRFPCNNTLRSNTSPLIDSGFFWHHSSSSLSKILSGGKQGLFWLQIISLNCAFGAFNNLLSSRIRHDWEVPWKIATLNHENQILWSFPWWKLSHLRFFSLKNINFSFKLKRLVLRFIRRSEMPKKPAYFTQSFDLSIELGQIGWGMALLIWLTSRCQRTEILGPCIFSWCGDASTFRRFWGWK